MDSTNTSALIPYTLKEQREKADRGKKIILEALHMPEWLKLLLKRYGITLLAFAVLWGNTAITAAIVRHNTTLEVTESLKAQYDAEYAEKIKAYQEEQQASRLLTDDESLQAAMGIEADEIARAIGTMKTKRMKLTMIWNILARVDSPFYPNTVKAVIEQPQQWMFYDQKNPIREDDRELAIEQLRLWHESRYPAGFNNTFVYGQWSDNDYVLRDTWEKNSNTAYWRFPE